MLLSSYGMMSKRANVVRSLGWDPRYHEEIWNGSENKIHIKKVLFQSSEMIPVFFTRNVLEGSGRSGTPEGKGTWMCHDNVEWLHHVLGHLAGQYDERNQIQV